MITGNCCILKRALLVPENLQRERKRTSLRRVSVEEPQCDVAARQKHHILAQWPCYIYLTDTEKKRGPDKVFFSVVVVIKVSPLLNLTVMFHKPLEFNSRTARI